MAHLLRSLLVALLLLIPAGALADIHAELASIAAHGQADGLRISVSDGLEETVRVGDDVTYRFEAAQGGHVTAFYVDAHGVATVVLPATEPLPAGGSVSFPPDGAALSIGPPVGPATLYAIATPEPIGRELLGLPPGDSIATHDSDRAAALANGLRSLLTGMPADSVAVAKIEHRVIGREDTEYTVADVVAYMGVRTRAIERPKLDLHVNFEFDSADLTSEGRQNLDVVGKALKHSDLSDDRFVLNGHTDDLGEPGYNDQLSVRRATAARNYLSETWSVDPSRLEVRGYGESKPLVTEPTDEARQLNRRVELELVR